MRAEPKTSSQVLYFIQEIKKEKQVLDLCRDMGIMIRKLKEEDAGRSVGVLAGVFPPELAPKTAKQVPKVCRNCWYSADWKTDSWIGSLRNTGGGESIPSG